MHKTSDSLSRKFLCDNLETANMSKLAPAKINHYTQTSGKR